MISHWIQGSQDQQLFSIPSHLWVVIKCESMALDKTQSKISRDEISMIVLETIYYLLRSVEDIPTSVERGRCQGGYWCVLLRGGEGRLYH